MPERKMDPLLLAGKILTLIMQGIMVIAGVALTVGVGVIIFASGEIQAEIVQKYGETVGAFPSLAVIGLLLLAIAVVALIFLFFGKLRQMIATVGQGDPFQPENADRLTAMAWILLIVQGLFIPLAALGFMIAEWASQFEDASFHMDEGFDLTGIMMVIVLFILARVFREGARMRDDLEGTV